MQDFLIEHYLWTKSLHIIAVISWMAGLFYLPRLFVYHTRAEAGSEQDLLFQLMEAKLLRIIMNPAMITAWIFGLLLITTPGIAQAGGGGWLYLKMAAVIALTAFHMMLARWRRLFAEGGNMHDEHFYRRVNEIPTLLMIVIVVMAVVKPF